MRLKVWVKSPFCIQENHSTTLLCVTKGLPLLRARNYQLMKTKRKQMTYKNVVNPKNLEVSLFLVYRFDSFPIWSLDFVEYACECLISAINLKYP